MTVRRGTYNFEVSNDGDVIYTRENLELLRKLWIDYEIISPDGPGPGDEGDFDNGAWHVACHVVAAGGVCRDEKGNLIWLKISYNKNNGLYESTYTTRENSSIVTKPINSVGAKEYLKNSELLGFVEGASGGRISSKGVVDTEDLFNGNLRQEYDQPVGSTEEGGKVWEHWCTTRDIRKTSKIGSSVLNAYLLLVEVLGDIFVSTVSRGRVDYHHPTQLRAMIKAGFVSPESAQLNIKPTVIPEKQSLLFQEATPESSLLAIEELNWDNPLKYYMFSRCINRWNEEFDL